MPNINDVRTFKNIMSHLESGNNDQVTHETPTVGIQKGTQAVGKYGQMPNTVKEMASRAIIDGLGSPLDGAIKASTPQNVNLMLKDNPEKKEQYATDLAEHVLDTTEGDPIAAAGGWLYGHNKSAQSMRSAVENDPKYKQRVLDTIDKLHPMSKEDEFSDKIQEMTHVPKEQMFSKIVEKLRKP